MRVGTAVGVGGEDMAGPPCPPQHPAAEDGLLGLRGHSFLQHSSERTGGRGWLKGAWSVQRLQVSLDCRGSQPGFATCQLCDLMCVRSFNSASLFLHLFLFSSNKGLL